MPIPIDQQAEAAWGGNRQEEPLATDDPTRNALDAWKKKDRKVPSDPNIAQRAADDALLREGEFLPKNTPPAEFEQAVQDPYADLEDLPTPQNPAEAQRAWLERGNIFLSRGEAATELLDLSDKIAMDYFRSLGLRGESGFKGQSGNLFRRVRGALYYNLSGLYAEFQSDEVGPVAADAMRRIGALLERTIAAQIPTEPGAEGAEELVQDLQEARRMQREAGEPSAHGFFFGELRAANKRLRNRNSHGSEFQRERAVIEEALLDIPYQIYGDANRSDIFGYSESSRSYRQLLSKHLRLFEEAGSTDRLLADAFRGTLFKHRFRRLGVDLDAPGMDPDLLSPSNALLFTHPALTREVMEQKAFIEAVAGADLEETELPETEKILQEMDEAAATNLAQQFILVGSFPLVEMQDVEMQFQQVAGDDAKARISRIVQGLGPPLMGALGGSIDFLKDSGRWWTRTLKMRDTISGIALARGTAMLEKRAELEGAVDETEALRRRILGEAFHRGDSFHWGESPENLKRDLRTLFPIRPDAAEILDLGFIFFGETAENVLSRESLFGVRPETMKMVYEEERDRLIDTFLEDYPLAGASKEDLDETSAAAASALRRWKDDPFSAGAFSEYAERGLATGISFLSNEWRNSIRFVLSDPETAGAAFVGGAISGQALSLVRRGIGKTPLAKFVASVSQATRAKILIRKALRKNPEAVQALRTFFTARQRGAGGEALAHNFQSAIDALDHLANASTLRIAPDGQPRLIRGWRKRGVDLAVERAVSAAKHLDPEGLAALMSNLKFDAMMQHWVRRAGPLRALVSASLDKLGFRVGERRMRAWSSQHATELLPKIIDNPNLDLKDLPLSIENLTVDSTPFWRRALPARFSRVLDTAPIADLTAKFFSAFQKDIAEARAFNADNKAMASDFLDHQVRSRLNRIEELRIAEVVDVEHAAAYRAARQELVEDALSVRSLKQRVDARHADTGLRLNRTRFFQDIDVNEIVPFLISKLGGEDELLLAIRQPFETRTATRARLYETLNRADVAPGSAKALKLARNAEQIKRELFDGFLNFRGINKQNRYDAVEGFVPLEKASRLARERKKLLEAQDDVPRLEAEEQALLEGSPTKAELRAVRAKLRQQQRRVEFGEDHPELFPDEAMDELFGVRSNPEATTFWQELKRAATAELANKQKQLTAASRGLVAGNLMENAGALHDGRLSTLRHSAKLYGMNMRAGKNAMIDKVSRMQRAFEKLDNEQQAAFEAAEMVQRDFGISKPLADLRKDPAFRELFDSIAPETDDLAVQNLLDNVSDFRKSLLRDLADGVFNEAELNKLLSPYAPRLFTAFESTRAHRGKNLYDQAMPRTGDGVNMGEFEASRHPSRFKAQVYPKDGRPIERLFDSREGAQRWLERTFGARKFSKEETALGNKSLRGQSDTGDELVIMDPLGEDFMRRFGALGLGGQGAATFRRLRSLIQDTFHARYFAAFDRKGISYTHDEFIAYKATPEGDSIKDEFVELPQARRLGTLSGKIVHKKVVRELNHWSDANLVQNSIADAVRAFSEKRSWVARAAMGGWKLLSGASSAMKDFIAYNHIMLSYKTMMGNMLTDALFFAPAAAGFGVNLTWNGVRAGLEAAPLVRKMLNRKIDFDSLPEDIRYGLENGLMDDTWVGTIGSRRARGEDLEGLFGRREQGILDALARPWRDPRLRKAMTREHEISRILTNEGDALTTAGKEVLLKEREALRRVLRSGFPKVVNGLADILDTAQWAFMGRRAGRLGDIENPAPTFYQFIGNWNRARSYLYMLREGVPRDEAIRRVNNFMQTYSRVPEALQKLSRTPLGSTIVSFPYEMARITGNIIKEQPSYMAAYLGANMGINFTSMAASGANPYAVFDSLRADAHDGMHWLIQMASSLVIPGTGGAFSIIQHPAMALPSALKETFGPIAGMSAPNTPNPTILDSLFTTARQAGSVWFLGGPIPGLIASAFSRRDVVTGRLHRTTGDALSSGVSNAMRTMIPPWFPIIGRNGRNMNESLQTGPRFYSGRVKGAFNQMLQDLTGLRIRGNILPIVDRALEGFTEKKNLGTSLAIGGTRAYGRLAGVDEELLANVRRIVGSGEISERDLLALTIFGTRAAEPGAQIAERFYDREFDELKFAVNVAEDPEASAGERKHALKMIDSAIKSLSKKMSVSEQLGDPRLIRKMTTREKVATLRAQIRGQELDTVMDSMSLLRKTEIIARMSEYGDLVSDKMLDRLLLQYTISMNTGDLRKPVNLDEIEQSLAVLGEFVTKPRGPQKTKYLERMARVLVSFIPGAVEDTIRSTLFETKTRRAYQLLQEAEGD